MFVEILNCLWISKHTEHDIKTLLTQQVSEENLRQLESTTILFNKQMATDYNKDVLKKMQVNTQ